jgi:hypothetical protein
MNLLMSFVQFLKACYSQVAGGNERASPAPLHRVRARIDIPWEGGTGSAVVAAAAAGSGVSPRSVLAGAAGWRVGIGGAMGGCTVVS